MVLAGVDPSLLDELDELDARTHDHNQQTTASPSEQTTASPDQQTTPKVVVLLTPEEEAAKRQERDERERKAADKRQERKDKRKTQKKTSDGSVPIPVPALGKGKRVDDDEFPCGSCAMAFPTLKMCTTLP
ncbi:hypothetical protein AaE_009363 [Aphanomyces astaci]|nr:hypothetical protein AaE_009363 [Aphanomyces astaci]